MKYFRLLTFIILASLSLYAFSQEKSRPKRLVLIEDYIFESKPTDELLPQTTMMFSIATPNGSHAMGMVLKDSLPEQIKKEALDVASIPEGALLLEMFKEAQERYKNAFKAPKIEEGTSFPTFSASDVNGKTWSNEDAKGKVMVLNLWYTGCGPCRAEMPELSQWKEEMPDVMFFSATYEKADRAKPVLEKHGFNWINLVDDQQFVKWIGANGYPLTIVIDKEGIIKLAVNGTSPEKREELKRKIQELR